MSRELLRLTKEATYGVYNTSPGGSDVLLLDIQQDNGYTVRPTNEYYEIRSAASSNMVVDTGSDVTNLAGKLMAYIRPGQVPWFLDTGIALTSGNCRDLKSFTADYGTFTEDGTCTAAYSRHLGCKFGAITLSCDNTAQGQLLMGSFDIVAKQPAAITVSDFAVPDPEDYDNTTPFKLRHTSGHVLLGGSARDVESISVAINNTLVPYRGNGRYISRLGWRGRSSTVTLKNLYLTNGDRADYENVVKKAFSIAFDDGVKTLTLDFGANNLIKGVADDFKMGDFNRQTLTIQNFLDGPGGVDFTAAVTTDA